MKKVFTSVGLFILVVCAVIHPASAQDINNNPGDYMTAINSSQLDMNKAYMAYVSASAHSSRKRKIDKMRLIAIDNIVICQSTIMGLPAYKGDNSLRQGALNYVQLCYKIFNQDYANIVNMEDIAERSYDGMQAYLLLQEATNDTLEVGNERISNAEKGFAAKYHVNLVSEKSELGEKMRAAGYVSKYRDKVFLVFFKCNWEDNQLNEALGQKNVSKVEQVRSAMQKYAVEGLAMLDTLHTFENDGSLADACRQALMFYKNEADTQIPMLTDFYLKEENFNKLKTAMDAKSPEQRTKQDVDSYNKAVNDMNAGVNTFNQTNGVLNNGRVQINNTWNATEKQFLDTHTPYYK
jgi:hypothetical protein